MSKPILSTDLKDLKLFKRGKVRDVYEVGDNLLIVATDRISAFDVVFPNGIPDKGKVLNQISLFWFNFLKDIAPNHIVAAEIKDYPASLRKYADILDKRSMLVKKTEVIPFECVVRGYLSGSAYKEYKEKGTACGVTLPRGMLESAKLPQSLFTPSTKEEHGHDINVDENFMAKKIGKELMALTKKLSLEIYNKAAAYALTKGIIIADTKFEFGIYHDKVILIDEALTPDSSRFWPRLPTSRAVLPPATISNLCAITWKV